MRDGWVRKFEHAGVTYTVDAKTFKIMMRAVELAYVYKANQQLISKSLEAEFELSSLTAVGFVQIAIEWYCGEEPIWLEERR